MNALIKIEGREISGATVQTCNARDLWEFIESKQDFSTWIKARIEKYGFAEGEDYVVHKFVDNPAGGRPTLDYHLTIEMAKELAMVENNDKGRQVRRYFIECEKRAKEATDYSKLSTMQILQIAMQAEQERLQLEQKVEELAPKAEALDLIAAGKDTVTMTEAAKILGIKRNDLTANLHARGWIYRQNGSWVAYDQHIRSGCLQYKEATYTDEKTGLECHKPYCHITPKGIAKLAVMIGRTP